MIDRTAILEDEFVRPPLPGLRLFSTGILKLCRKLGLAFAVAASQRAKMSEEEAERDFIAATWLLDARNDLDTIKRGADLGRERFFAEVLADYEFNLPPSLLALAKVEIARTNAAVEHAAVVVQPKPSDTAGAAPPGNS